jgi:hypothetical protein
MKSSVAFVFDLDKTIGYFTQFAIFMEGIEEYFNKKITKKQFFKLLDLYPDVFRPDMFKIFRHLKRLKQKKKRVKVLIYTNNNGPKSWVHDIKKYIEHKINYELFDRTIAAWKVNGKIYEKCRTSYDKSYKDLLACSMLSTKYNIMFFDDQPHPKMKHEKINYLYLKGYKHDIKFTYMIKKFLKSKIFVVKDKEKFTDFIIKFSKSDPLGFKYKESPISSKHNYNKKLLLKLVKKFLKDNKLNVSIKKTRKTGKRHRTRKKRSSS